MTRINLVPPEELMDQHLFAEFREIKMIPKSLGRSIALLQKRYIIRNNIIKALMRRIPAEFTLNTGHVSFFYDKGGYLRKRYEAIKAELRVRGVKFNEDSALDPDGVYKRFPELAGDYLPTPEALVIIRQRIAEKIARKPDWYRYSGARNEISSTT